MQVKCHQCQVHRQLYHRSTRNQTLPDLEARIQRSGKCKTHCQQQDTKPGGNAARERITFQHNFLDEHKISTPVRTYHSDPSPSTSKMVSIRDETYKWLPGASLMRPAQLLGVQPTYGSRIKTRYAFAWIALLTSYLFLASYLVVQLPCNIMGIDRLLLNHRLPIITFLLPSKSPLALTGSAMLQAGSQNWPGQTRIVSPRGSL